MARRFNQPTAVLITGPQCSGKHRLMWSILAGWDSNFIPRHTTNKHLAESMGGLVVQHFGPGDGDIAPMEYHGHYWAVDADCLDATLALGGTPVIVVHPDQITRMKDALRERGFASYLVYCAAPESVRRSKLINRMSVGVDAHEVQQAMTDLLERVDYMANVERTMQCRFSWDHITTHPVSVPIWKMQSVLSIVAKVMMVVRTNRS